MLPRVEGGRVFLPDVRFPLLLRHWPQSLSLRLVVVVFAAPLAACEACLVWPCADWLREVWPAVTAGATVPAYVGGYYLQLSFEWIVWLLGLPPGVAYAMVCALYASSAVCLLYPVLRSRTPVLLGIAWLAGSWCVVNGHPDLFFASALALRAVAAAGFGSSLAFVFAASAVRPDLGVLAPLLLAYRYGATRAFVVSSGLVFVVVVFALRFAPALYAVLDNPSRSAVLLAGYVCGPLFACSLPAWLAALVIVAVRLRLDEWFCVYYLAPLALLLVWSAPYLSASLLRARTFVSGASCIF